MKFRIALAAGAFAAAPLSGVAMPTAHADFQCADGSWAPDELSCPSATPWDHQQFSEWKYWPDNEGSPPPPPTPVAPTDAVTMSVVPAGLQVNVTVGNTSGLAADCTFDATEANGLGMPVHRDFRVAAKGSVPMTFPAPLLGQSWNLIAACTAPFDGQTVQIGRTTGTAP